MFAVKVGGIYMLRLDIYIYMWVVSFLFDRKEGWLVEGFML